MIAHQPVPGELTFSEDFLEQTVGPTRLIQGLPGRVRNFPTAKEIFCKEMREIVLGLEQLNILAASSINIP